MQFDKGPFQNATMSSAEVSVKINSFSWLLAGLKRPLNYIRSLSAPSLLSS